MNYLTTPWVKLYRTPDADWVRLPLSARGLGSESLKYARAEDGFLIDTEGEPLGIALAYFMGARPAEHERIQADADKLLVHGFYELRGTRVYVRNFVEAQTKQSPAAIRKARQRAKEKAEQDAQRDPARDPSRDTSRGGRHALSRGNETKRNELKRTEDADLSAGDRLPLQLVPAVEAPRFNFEAVYKQHFPRKEGKVRGLALCAAQVKTEADFAAWTLAVKNYAVLVRSEKRETQHVKHFSSFMACWRDYIDMGPAGGPAPTRPASRGVDEVLAEAGVRP